MNASDHTPNRKAEDYRLSQAAAVLFCWLWSLDAFRRGWVVVAGNAFFARNADCEPSEIYALLTELQGAGFITFEESAHSEISVRISGS